MKTIILAAAAACLCWTASAQQTTTTTTTTTATTIVAADDAGQESDGGSGFEWSVGVDLNSNYVWRGYDQSANGKFFNLNIQPCVTLGYKGLWLELWDTNAFNGSYNEFDITLGYTIGGFEISVSDYYFDFESPYFSDYNASHSLCATVSYTLSERIPLKLSWRGLPRQRQARLLVVCRAELCPHLRQAVRRRGGGGCVALQGALLVL